MLHKNVLAKSGFRELNDVELSVVSGGGGDTQEGEIVVTGTRMTDSQKLAYDTAYNRAWWDMVTVQIFGLGGLALSGQGGAVGAAVLGVLDNRTDWSDDTIADLAELYYDLDGADGTHDGWNEFDRQGYPGLEARQPY